MTQVLLVLIKKQPPDGRKLLVIGTSSAGEPAVPEATPSPGRMPACNDQRAAAIPSCHGTLLQLVAAAWEIQLLLQPDAPGTTPSKMVCMEVATAS